MDFCAGLDSRRRSGFIVTCAHPFALRVPTCFEVTQLPAGQWTKNFHDFAPVRTGASSIQK